MPARTVGGIPMTCGRKAKRQTGDFHDLEQLRCALADHQLTTRGPHGNDRSKTKDAPAQKLDRRGRWHPRFIACVIRSGGIRKASKMMGARYTTIEGALSRKPELKRQVQQALAQHALRQLHRAAKGQGGKKLLSPRFAQHILAGVALMGGKTTL